MLLELRDPGRSSIANDVLDEIDARLIRDRRNVKLQPRELAEAGSDDGKTHASSIRPIVNPMCGALRALPARLETAAARGLAFEQAGQPSGPRWAFGCGEA